MDIPLAVSFHSHRDVQYVRDVGDSSYTPLAGPCTTKLVVTFRDRVQTWESYYPTKSFFRDWDKTLSGLPQHNQLIDLGYILIEEKQTLWSE